MGPSSVASAEIREGAGEGAGGHADGQVWGPEAQEEAPAQGAPASPRRGPGGLLCAWDEKRWRGQAAEEPQTASLRSMGSPAAARRAAAWPRQQHSSRQDRIFSVRSCFLMQACQLGDLHGLQAAVPLQRAACSSARNAASQLAPARDPSRGSSLCLQHGTACSCSAFRPGVVRGFARA
jgi:hypothetical protein